MIVVQEVYNPKPLGANTTTTVFPAGSVCSFGGFYCTAAGTFELQDAASTDIIAAHALVVGGFVIGGCVCGNGLKVVLSGGCAGTLYFGTVA